MDELRLILIIAGIIVLALVYFFSRRANQGQESTDEESLQDDTEWMEEIARQRRKLAENKARQSTDDAPPDVPVLDDVLIDTPDETTAPILQPEPEPKTRSDTALAAENHSTEEKASLLQLQEETTAPPQEKALTTAAEPSPLAGEKQPDPSALPPQQELIVVLHVSAPKDMVFVGANLFSALEEIGLRFGEGGIFHYHHSQHDEESKNAVLFSVANILEPGTFESEQMEQEFTTPGVVMFMRAPGAVSTRNMVETLLLKAQQLAQLLGGEIRDEAHNLINETTIKSLLDQAIAFDNNVNNATKQ